MSETWPARIADLPPLLYLRGYVKKNGFKRGNRQHEVCEGRIKIQDVTKTELSNRQMDLTKKSHSFTSCCVPITFLATPENLITADRVNLLFSFVHSVEQKSIGLKFSKSRTGSDVRYSCHHDSSCITFPIFAHSCRFSVLHSLQSITPRIY